MFNIFKILFPDVCLSCRRVGDVICKKCILDLKAPIVNEVLTENNTVSAFSYKDTAVREMVWRLKYKNNKELVKILSPILLEYIQSIYTDIVLTNPNAKIVLIPIPIHKEKIKQRGYNQSEILCDEIINIKDKNLKISYAKNCLIKTDNNSPLAKSRNKQDREKFIKDTFKVVGSELIKDSTVILLDDVITSGATISEARKTLIRSGAKLVFGVTIAH